MPSNMLFSIDEGGEKKANKSLEEFLIGPELANLAALRALETGTLSSGSPRRSETGASQTASAEILGSQPVTKSEKRRKSKDRVERERHALQHVTAGEAVQRSPGLRLAARFRSGHSPTAPPQIPAGASLKFRRIQHREPGGCDSHKIWQDTRGTTIAESEQRQRRCQQTSRGGRIRATCRHDACVSGSTSDRRAE